MSITWISEKPLHVRLKIISGYIKSIYKNFDKWETSISGSNNPVRWSLTYPGLTVLHLLYITL